jgi:hypothetical protein
MTTTNRSEARQLVNAAFEEVDGKEGKRPKLNKFDPGSLLGYTVYLLESKGLDEAAKKVREVSKDVSQAWQGREDR